MNGRVVVLSPVSLPRLCFTTENLGDHTNGRPWVESEQTGKDCWIDVAKMTVNQSYESSNLNRWET